MKRKLLINGANATNRYRKEIENMTVKSVKNKVEKLADEIDEYLGELERNNKTNSNKYETLLFIAGGLRELVEVEL